MVTIHLARSQDATGIAQVHVDSWRTTYKGIISDDYLASLTYEPREQMWHRALANPQHAIYVAEDANQNIIGFCAGGPERQQDPIYRGEIYAIYLLAAYQGQGIGKRLMQTLAQRLINDGITSMLLWVLAANPACRFYEALGGQHIRSQDEQIGDRTLQEHAYGWLDIAPLKASKGY